MDDRDRKLTDTGKQRAIAREEAEGVVERAIGNNRHSETLTMPRASESNDHLRAWISGNQNDCFNCGPGSKLWGAIEKMNDKIDRKLDEVSDEIGAMKLAKATEDGKNAELAKQAGKTAAWQMAVISAVCSLAVGLALFGLNRYWPPQAHASPSQVQTVGK
jgi:hypothetical protein